MILVITKRHIDRKRKKHPTVSLQGRKQTITNTSTTKTSL